MQQMFQIHWIDWFKEPNPIQPLEPVGARVQVKYKLQIYPSIDQLIQSTPPQPLLRSLWVEQMDYKYRIGTNGFYYWGRSLFVIEAMKLIQNYFVGHKLFVWPKNCIWQLEYIERLWVLLVISCQFADFHFKKVLINVENVWLKFISWIDSENQTVIQLLYTIL